MLKEAPAAGDVAGMTCTVGVEETGVVDATTDAAAVVVGVMTFPGIAGVTDVTDSTDAGVDVAVAIGIGVGVALRVGVERGDSLTTIGAGVGGIRADSHGAICFSIQAPTPLKYQSNAIANTTRAANTAAAGNPSDLPVLLGGLIVPAI